jgi:hypothetical protein
MLLRSRPSDGTINALVNDQTDRLYLISDDGLVQCFHEIGAQAPLYHNPPEPKPEATEQTPGSEAGAAAPAAAPGQPPAGDEALPADEGDAFPDDPEPMADPVETQPAAEPIFGVEEPIFGEEP